MTDALRAALDGFAQTVEAMRQMEARMAALEAAQAEGEARQTQIEAELRRRLRVIDLRAIDMPDGPAPAERWEQR